VRNEPNSPEPVARTKPISRRAGCTRQGPKRDPSRLGPRLAFPDSAAGKARYPIILLLYWIGPAVLCGLFVRNKPNFLSARRQHKCFMRKWLGRIVNGNSLGKTKPIRPAAEQSVGASGHPTRDVQTNPISAGGRGTRPQGRGAAVVASNKANLGAGWDPSDETRETNPIWPRAACSASTLWERSYGETDSAMTLGKQSQSGGVAIARNKANSPRGGGIGGASPTLHATFKNKANFGTAAGTRPWGRWGGGIRAKRSQFAGLDCFPSSFQYSDVPPSHLRADIFSFFC
jgi:hypothetical protein